MRFNSWFKNSIQTFKYPCAYTWVKYLQCHWSSQGSSWSSEGSSAHWMIFIGWMAGQICHAIPENGFNSPVLQAHYNIEIPVPLCIDATKEQGRKDQIRNRNSCSHGCWRSTGKLCQGCVPLPPNSSVIEDLPSVKPATPFRKEPKVHILSGYKLGSPNWAA